MEIYTKLILILEEEDFVKDHKIIKDYIANRRIGSIVVPDELFDGFEESELYDKIKDNCTIGGLRFFDFKKLSDYNTEQSENIRNAK